MNYLKNRDKSEKIICASVVTEGMDDRPFAEVEVGGISFTGLLDSGANISILGHECEKFLDATGIKLKSLSTHISTASGEKQRIIGYVDVVVDFLQKSHLMRLYLVPSLQQKLYLGVDFWHMFGMKPVMVDEIVANVKENITDDQVSVIPSNVHVLTDSQRKELDQVIKLFPNCINLGLGRTSLLSHSIDTRNAKPVKQRLYSLSPAKQNEAYQELDRMLEAGVIQESRSSWCAPVAIVHKANGKPRLCLDARKLNELTVKDAYPMPLIEGLLSRLDRTKYITSIDLKDAFWQIPLDPESREKTAFAVPGRPLYDFVTMPFGLCNAAQSLCRLMDKVIPHQFHDRVFVYLDDLLVASADFEEHLQLLREIAKRLELAGLTINVEKSKFVLKSIEYLGYIVGDGTLSANPEKVRAIAEFPVPKTVKQVRRFVGVTGWYRRFIANYSSKAAPLTSLTGKKKKFVWSQEAQAAFELLKESLLTAPVLIQPDFKKHFFIQCDASTTGIGSVLFQKSDDGSEHPIAYYSHKLTGSQRNYSVTELECLAAVLSIKKFRCYVEGHPFTVITDHNSLKWLMDQKDLTSRLTRWSLKLQAYNFNIEYRRGSENTVADALSRMNMEEITVGADDDIDPVHIDLNSPSFQHPDYVKFIELLTREDSTKTNMCVEDGKIFINTNVNSANLWTDNPEWKLVVPMPLRLGLIVQSHNSPTAAHMGIAKTLERIRRRFYWIGIGKDVAEYVNKCESCKQNKSANSTLRPPLGAKSDTFRPFQKIYVDFLGPYPRTKNRNAYMIIALDHFSRYVFLKAVPNATAIALVKFLEKDIFLPYGTPERLFSDNGRQLESNLLANLLQKYGVKHEFTPKYSPQANASERVNRSLLMAVRSYIKSDQRTWDEHLDEITQALRNTKHDSLKYSPHFVVFNQHLISHGSDYALLEKLYELGGDMVTMLPKEERRSAIHDQLIENLRKSFEKNSNYYNLRSCSRQFTPGDVVYVRSFSQSDAAKSFNAKLSPKFIKATVLRPIGNVAYEVHDAKGKTLGVYHLKDIRT